MATGPSRENFKSVREVKAFCLTLRRTGVSVRVHDRLGCGLLVDVDVVIETEDGSERHSISASCSSPARVAAHFEGFCRTIRSGDVWAAPVGALVSFPSGSDPSGRRFGRVVKSGPRRVVVRYKFKHGGVAEKTVRHEDVVIVERPRAAARTASQEEVSQ